MSGKKIKNNTSMVAASRPVARAETGAARKSTSFIPVRASFDAASRSPESSRHWRGADFLSADAALSPDIRRIIISRARYEVANNGYASGILKTLSDDCIGTGPRLQLSIDGIEGWSEDWEMMLERRERRWRNWCKAVKLRRKLKMARRTKAQDGEVFIQLGINPKIKNPVKLDLTLFESEQVGSPLMTSMTSYHLNGAPKEVDGIIYDEYGNDAEYRFLRIHPGSNGLSSSLVGDSYTVKSDAVIHYANLIRPGQHRGIPEIASTLPNFNDLRRFTNAVLAAAETAAEISFVVSTDNPAPDDDGESRAAHLDPGLIMEFCRNSGVALPEGWKATQLKAEQPTENHSEFVRTKIREASRAISMPLNVALGDSSGYNYASGRLDHQVYFRTIDGERAEIEEEILDKVLDIFQDFDKLFFPNDYPEDMDIDHEWMWDGFAHVDPLKEANAQSIRLQSKTSTRADECGAEGKDSLKILRKNIREEYIEKKLRKKYGLPEAQNDKNNISQSQNGVDDDEEK